MQPLGLTIFIDPLYMWRDSLCSYIPGCVRSDTRSVSTGEGGAHAAAAGAQQGTVRACRSNRVSLGAPREGYIWVVGSMLSVSVAGVAGEVHLRSKSAVRPLYPELLAFLPGGLSAVYCCYSYLWRKRLAVFERGRKGQAWHIYLQHSDRPVEPSAALHVHTFFFGKVCCAG